MAGFSLLHGCEATLSRHYFFTPHINLPSLNPNIYGKVILYFYFLHCKTLSLILTQFINNKKCESDREWYKLHKHVTDCGRMNKFILELIFIYQLPHPNISAFHLRN
jgi:hypothetical protein